MFWQSFQTTTIAIGQIFLLGAIGFFLVRKNLLGQEGLGAISRLVMEVTMPLFIFSKLVLNFKFGLYPNWWVFPLLSVLITVVGLLVGWSLLGFIRGKQTRRQFVSLIAFQNSGYLPLALIGALLQGEQGDTLFVYLFLFLLGFNLLMFSLGAYILTSHEKKQFEFKKLFSPPVVATLFSLLLIFFGLEKFVPAAVIHPLRITGECTLPLAMFVVGGNLAQINLKHLEKRAILLVLLAKLIILPLFGLWVVLNFNLPELISLLIIIQLAVPSAASSSVIISHYKKEDLLISQGIFMSHFFSILTLPLFLSLYFYLSNSR